MNAIYLIIIGLITLKEMEANIYHPWSVKHPNDCFVEIK